ncbi:ATP-binding cassette domain-containing protein [Larsenimonas suaedae]|uniref:Dipeptide/oligopeptide/nickel ABC transporter ATP-binding protein n=1 Tax=Larsenimonas suaedae TaxID=1851019 RepID=A0ABU1GUJ2_9GAMM|nr:dipeptide/oligopeptide/nickel ABC transporter ATP-binding protein [Larsenimonas suaedae]MCM2970957.1 dipeptide/oligopeptide/nickel ABC transporter ATP-binding protein [Larsenimonas suaedae]MDR5895666.1 dipeptide/oligopeptide/nickel ABC transporter ATP-binding protein [Larsenimonas suaedae]
MTSSAYDSVLEVEDLCIHLGGRMVVDHLTFRLGVGERMCLLGPSGSGKSLTARALLGLSSPRASVSGAIRINGIDVSARKAMQRPETARVGMVFQNTQAALNPLVTVGAQLRAPFIRFHGMSQRDAQRAAIELLGRMRVEAPDQVVQRSSGELSGGQRQRVCLALALACRPSLLVADEPTTALDVLAQADVLSLLSECTGTDATPSLLFISHDMSAAARLCDRAVILDEGRLVEEGALEKIMARPSHRFSKSLVDAIERHAVPAARSNGLEAFSGCACHI